MVKDNLWRALITLPTEFTNISPIFYNLFNNSELPAFYVYQNLVQIHGNNAEHNEKEVNVSFCYISKGEV